MSALPELDFRRPENHAAALSAAREVVGDGASVDLERGSGGGRRLRITGCTFDEGRSLAVDVAGRLGLWGDAYHEQRSVACSGGFVCVWLC